MNNSQETTDYNKIFQSNTPQEVIAWALGHFGKKIAFSTSMGLEDQVILHMISEIDKSTNVFTLDTGRLFPEAYDLIDISTKKYGIPINVFFPDAAQVESMVHAKGINLFYDSIENRKHCCHIRKVEPLKRAFKDLDAWICGLRQGQSIARMHSQLFEWDEKFGLMKINPLVNWTNDQVWTYIRQHKIPYNTLHDKGFPSIGCQPCTRAVFPGEDARSGRWWWENQETRECGLHVEGD